MRFKNLVGLIALCLLSRDALSTAAHADPGPMSYIYNLDQSELTERDQYLDDVIRTALERTRADYGDYILKRSADSREQRRIHALEHETGEITFGLLPARRNLEEKLYPVRISIDRGILGYRVLLIRGSDQRYFSKIQTLADLQQIAFGMLESWAATAVLRNAELNVVIGNSYNGLFKMLEAGRFDALDRSAYEILPEYRRQSASLHDLAIEQKLLLHYPLPDYFWFTNTAEGRRRAARLQAGLASMEADGSLDAMFQKTFGPAIKELGLAHRRIIELPNPMLSPEDLLDSKAPWYRPANQP